jgi:hypothetical protein
MCMISFIGCSPRIAAEVFLGDLQNRCITRDSGEAASLSLIAAVVVTFLRIHIVHCSLWINDSGRCMKKIGRWSFTTRRAIGCVLYGREFTGSGVVVTMNDLEQSQSLSTVI